MAQQISQLNNEVTAFLDALDHPFRNEIQHLRELVLAANEGLTENIKWNGPNYCFNQADRITMRIQPPKKQVQLIFHRGAGKQPQPKEKLITNPSALLVWKENDRAIITFNSLQEIEERKAVLTSIITDWIHATE